MYTIEKFAMLIYAMTVKNLEINNLTVKFLHIIKAQHKAKYI